MPTAERVDVAVVGAGLVGLATARALLERHPPWQVLVLEKEASVAAHQSGHNSGVVHSGVYYRPGSEKARHCARGRSLLRAFAEAHGLPYRPIGKWIVATGPEQLPGLAELEARGRAQGLPGLRRRSAEEIAAEEPAVRGVSALEVPTAAITDYPAVARALAEEIRARGGEIRFGVRIERWVSDGGRVRLEGPEGATVAGWAVNCGGLFADRLARSSGLEVPVRILPFRGEYYLVPPERLGLRRLIYPVPDPRFPFLGVHLTPRVDGRIEAGPNAVPALAREGYRWTDVSFRDLAEALTDPGAIRLGLRHARTEWQELEGSLSRRRYAARVAELAPGLSADDLRSGGAGVRAQAVDRKGRLVDDFVIVDGPRSTHVLNAPSPAATASLSLGEAIAARVPIRDETDARKAG